MELPRGRLAGSLQRTRFSTVSEPVVRASFGASERQSQAVSSGFRRHDENGSEAAETL